MDWWSYEAAARRLAGLLPTGRPGLVLDVGSYEVSTRWQRWLRVPAGHRSLVPKPHRLVGVDFAVGPGVDVVADVTAGLPFGNNLFDVVVTSSMLEHCAAPWRAMPELGRLVRAGGHLLCVVPRIYPQHRFPRDYWRVLPDGMAELLTLAECEVVEAGTAGPYTVGIGRRIGAAD